MRYIFLHNFQVVYEEFDLASYLIEHIRDYKYFYFMLFK